MPKVNVYLPDALAAEVREAGISISPVCQRALEQEVARMKVKTSIGDKRLGAAVARMRGEAVQAETDDHADGYEHGQTWALEQATPRQLEDMAEWSVQNWLNPEIEHVAIRGEFIESFQLDASDPWSQGFVEGAMAAWQQLSEWL